MTDDATLAYYEREAPFYRVSSSQAPSRHLAPFLAMLEPRSSILELGCGGGRDAAHMIECGFLVDATDGTAAMVKKANERHGVNARQMRFDELSATHAYDAVWAHASLLHLPRADLPPVLLAIRRALKPGGWHFANFKLGDAEHPDEGRDLLGRWTNLPSPEWLEQSYQAAGFSIDSIERYRGNGSDGTQRDWLALTVRAL
ncbi:class I SAM-dependent methyltransferase [Erythrobacter sp. MTPC3]|uniref:class I SAM-dependent methyltransferase n=1 Tax=Erythrobacter sp. MTPC3 TaxID=3056564 RepID=UPI0036F2D115